MKRALSVLSLMTAFAACGSSEDSPGPAGSWCPRVPQLTTDSATDLTGLRNTYRRVRQVHERYANAILERCPEVTSVGIGKTRPSATVNDPALPPGRAKRLSDREPDHVLSVGLRSAGDRPDGPLYLRGVRVEFHVTGEIKPLSEGR